MISGNFELQQTYLTDWQREVSARLFEQGVVSRVVQMVTPTGAVVPVEGIDQLDKLFVPGISHTRAGSKVQRLLSLVAIAKGNGQSYSYFGLGQLDGANILYPYPEVNTQDAETVHQAAKELLAAKENGMLPHLSDNLLKIQNPNLGMLFIARDNPL